MSDRFTEFEILSSRLLVGLFYKNVKDPSASNLKDTSEIASGLSWLFGMATRALPEYDGKLFSATATVAGLCEIQSRRMNQKDSSQHISPLANVDPTHGILVYNDTGIGKISGMTAIDIFDYEQVRELARLAFFLTASIFRRQTAEGLVGDDAKRFQQGLGVISDPLEFIAEYEKLSNYENGAMNGYCSPNDLKILDMYHLKGFFCQEPPMAALGKGNENMRSLLTCAYAGHPAEETSQDDTVAEANAKMKDEKDLHDKLNDPEVMRQLNEEGKAYVQLDSGNGAFVINPNFVSNLNPTANNETAPLVADDDNDDDDDEDYDDEDDEDWDEEEEEDEEDEDSSSDSSSSYSMTYPETCRKFERLAYFVHTQVQRDAWKDVECMDENLSICHGIKDWLGKKSAQEVYELVKLYCKRELDCRTANYEIGGGYSDEPCKLKAYYQSGKYSDYLGYGDDSDIRSVHFVRDGADNPKKGVFHVERETLEKLLGEVTETNGTFDFGSVLDFLDRHKGEKTEFGWRPQKVGDGRYVITGHSMTDEERGELQKIADERNKLVRKNPEDMHCSSSAFVLDENGIENLFRHLDGKGSDEPYNEYNHWDSRSVLACLITDYWSLINKESDFIYISCESEESEGEVCTACKGELLDEIREGEPL